ncbi:MAG: MATE family efflux transporter, partial [Thermoflexaceae bacterium]|nr:MATE family efflux transporter [Thermoflexaceae bacterium]
MKQQEQDLTQGSLGRQILAFSFPLMLSNILQVLFNMADIAVVGRFAGSTALGAVGSTTTLVTLFTSFLIGMSGGINVLVALHIGARNPKEVKETVHSAALVSVITGFLLMFIGTFFAKGILEILRTKPELIDGASLYLRIYFLGMPALAMYNYGNAVLSAAGDTRRPLRYLSVAGVVNIVLNLFFVIVCGMEVEGVAVASVLSQYISAILIVRALLQSKEVYALHPYAIRFNQEKVKAILALGLPSGLQ